MALGFRSEIKHLVDLAVFGFYLIALPGIGRRFFERNESADDYYLGGRDMSSLHVNANAFGIAASGAAFLLLRRVELGRK